MKRAMAMRGRCRAVVRTVCGAACLCACFGVSAAPVAASALDETDMFPFVPSYERLEPVVDMSHLLDAPAGKNGRIRVEGGHFVNDRGRVRLHATNLTGPANFPTHEEAERLALRFAQFGINCVRLHYFDSDYGTFMLPSQPGIVADDFRTRRRLDAAQRDRQDYLVAQFKKRGIYVNVNLHVARTLDARDGFAPGTPWANKGVDQFDPRVIAAEREYARDLLSHVNPYTGMSYLKDPVVAVVELNNEDALIRQYLDGGMDALGQPYATVFKNLWNSWLVERYGTAGRLLAAWDVRKIPFGEEQVAEGAFDGAVKADGRRWILDLGDARAAFGSAGGALRVSVDKAGGEFFPKVYRRVAVKKGMPYTVKFRMRRVSGQAGEVGFAVADRRAGWQSLGVLTRFTPTEKWAERSFSFYAPDDVPQAEIQFTRFGKGVYEIDDLSFRVGAKTPALEGRDPAKGQIPVVKSRDAVPLAMRSDFYQFLVDTERAYWTGMRKFLRDIGLEAPVSGTQLDYSPPHVQAELDYVDDHAYWCHPSVHAGWQIRNAAMVNSGWGGCIAAMAARRVAGKPYTVSEYNHPYPNFYGAEGQPMLRAYGALQGWDGVFEYSYNNRIGAEPTNNTYFFNLAARTDVLAHFPACAALYLRGDVKESATRIVGNLPYAGYFDRFVRHNAVSQGIDASAAKLPHNLGLVHHVAVDVTGQSPAVSASVKRPGAVVVSDTGELTWNVEKAGAGCWTADTPNAKVFTGFPAGRAFDLHGVRIEIGKTKLGWATVSLVSHDATGFGEAGRPASILLTATGLCHNGGAKFTDHSDGSISCRGADWGAGKTVCEGVNATIALPSAPDRTRCWALDERGVRKASVPVAAAPDGGAQVVIGPQYATVWYEVRCL